MSDEPEVGGDAGSPAPAEAGGSQPDFADEIIKGLDSSPAPAPAEAPKIGLDEGLLKQLETMDPEALPQGLRARLEKPFLSLYGKKTTEWDNERRSYVDAIRDLTKRLDLTGTVGQETSAQVEDLMANGDYKGAAQLLRDEIRQEITPERQYVNTSIAINEAKHLMPDLAKYEMQVAEVIKADPVVAELTRINNSKYAGKVIAALAFQAQNAELRKQLSDQQALFDTKLRQAIAETQRRIKGLPSSTSRAGSTPSATPSKELNLRQAMEEAFAEQVGG